LIHEKEIEERNKSMIGIMNFYRLERIDEINELLKSDISENEKENLLEEKKELLKMNDEADRIDEIVRNLY